MSPLTSSLTNPASADARPATSGPNSFTRIPIGIDSQRRARVRDANRRLAIVMALIAAAFMTLATVVYLRTMSDAEASALRRLETFNMLRHDSIHAFFVTHENEARVWSENIEFEERAREIFVDWANMTTAEKTGVREAFTQARPLTDPTPAQAVYLEHYARITPKLLDFITHHKFYDLFLFSPDGELAYTVTREDDFGLNYGADGSDASNPYYDSGLGRVFRQASKLEVRVGEALPTAVSDFEPYAPSGSTMQSFIAEPLTYAGGSERLGVLAIQLSFSEFDNILSYRSGQSDTVRTLLVGADSEIRNSPQSLGLEPDADMALDTEPVRTALAGNVFRGESRGERGQPIYAASQPLDFHGLRWAVLTEIDRSEVRDPLRVFLWIYLFALLGIALTTFAMYQIIRIRR